MRDYAAQLIGVSFSKAKLTDELVRCAKQEHDAVYKLYDMGYLTAPVMTDLSELLYSMIEEEPDLRRLFWTRTGAFDLSSLRFEYVSLHYNKSATLHNALDYAAQAIQAREVMQDIKGLINCIRLPRRTDSITLRVTPSVSKGIVSNYKKPFLMTGNLAKCVGNADKSVMVVDLDRYRLSYLRKNGYSDLSGGGDELDLKFMRLYLTGEVIGNGADAERLYQQVHTNLSKGINSTAKLVDDTLELCSERLNYLNVGRCLYITDRYAVFETNNRYRPPKLQFRDYEMGSFVRGISPAMQLLGFGGEFDSSGDLPFGIEPVGVSFGDHGLVLPRFFAEISDTDIHDGMDIYWNEEDVCQVLGVSDLDKIRFEFINSVGDSGTWYRLLGELLQCYAYAICDKVRRGRRSSRHVVLSSEFDGITQADFIEACKAVERLLEPIGLI